MVKANRTADPTRTKRDDRIDNATGDMLKRMKALRPELRARALAQFLLFASHMAGIARPSGKAREAA